MAASLVRCDRPTRLVVVVNDARVGQRKGGLLIFQLEIFTQLIVFLLQLLQRGELLTQGGKLLIGLVQLLL